MPSQEHRGRRRPSWIETAWIVAVLVMAVGTDVLVGQAPAAQGRQGAGQVSPPPAAPVAGIPRQPLGDGPWVFEAAERTRFRVVVVTKGLVNPWSLVFLPDGNMLVTERHGRLRIIRNGVLDAQPIAGVPEVRAMRLNGLMDLALHPRFPENGLVYFTYTKPGDNGLMATTLARGRLVGMALEDVQDLLIAEPWWDGAGGSASTIVFGPDGMLYMTTGTSGVNVIESQDTSGLRGKVLRLRDDGTVPPDNPFVGRAGYRPEIYSLGHRNTLGIAVHPRTGAIWNAEMGPNGGDEINIILPGRNYGWPLVSFGRTYQGPWQGAFAKEGMEPPHVFWTPSISVSGLMFYTGDRFPAWKGNVFVGGLRFGEIAGTGLMQRIVFNEKDEEMRRENLLADLRQRIRQIRQGPDGLLYVLTDENPGALLRIGPAD